MSAIQHEIDKGADALIIEPSSRRTSRNKVKNKGTGVIASELSSAPENTS